MKSALFRSQPQGLGTLSFANDGQKTATATFLKDIAARMDVPQQGTRERGRMAEDTAMRLLESAGLRVMARNFRCKLGEIDLIAESGTGMLVFVEVKLRSHPNFGGALAALSAAQRRRLVRAAQAFMASRAGLAGRPCRFDLIALQDPSDGNRGAVWIPDAFSVDGR